MHAFTRWLVGIMVILILPGCAPTPSKSIPSPDGRLALVTSVNRSKADVTTYLCVRFQIVDSTGKVLYEEQTHASDRMRWKMSWEGSDRVVLDSSDIGTLAWERQADGSWHAAPCCRPGNP